MTQGKETTREEAGILRTSLKYRRGCRLRGEIMPATRRARFLPALTGLVPLPPTQAPLPIGNWAQVPSVREGKRRTRAQVPRAQHPDAAVRCLGPERPGAHLHREVSASQGQPETGSRPARVTIHSRA